MRSRPPPATGLVRTLMRLLSKRP